MPSTNHVPERVRDSVWLKLLGLAVLATMLAHGASSLPFITDDALISLRYSERLLDGQGLTWNDGERVEGYSNLLWVLLSAAPGGAGMNLIVAVRALGLAAAGVQQLQGMIRWTQPDPLGEHARPARGFKAPW